MEHLSQEGDDKSLPENAVTKVQAPKPNRFFEKEYVDSLREDVVKDIFAAIAKKAGVNTTMEKFIPFRMFSRSITQRYKKLECTIQKNIRSR